MFLKLPFKNKTYYWYHMGFLAHQHPSVKAENKISFCLLCLQYIKHFQSLNQSFDCRGSAEVRKSEKATQYWEFYI